MAMASDARSPCMPSNSIYDCEVLEMIFVLLAGFPFSFLSWLHDMPMNERIKAFRFGIDNKHFSGALNGQNLRQNFKAAAAYSFILFHCQQKLYFDFCKPPNSVFRA